MQTGTEKPLDMITHHSSLDSFYKQIEYVLNEYKPHGLKASEFNNVFVGGLGGSGIGGRIAKGFFFSGFPIPVEVVSDYNLPAYVSDKSLVILSSYSGNTEETLSMFEEAKERGCKIIAVTGGGNLRDKATQRNLPTYIIEPGYQPRMALGYSLGFMLKILAELEGSNIDDDLLAVAESLRDNLRHKNIAEQMRRKFLSSLKNKFVIIADAAFEGVAIRLQQQLNENSKCEAFVNLLPEANHNVIESYYGQLPANFIVLNSNSNERVAARFSFVISLLERDGNRVFNLETEGLDLVTLFDLIHANDWFSLRVAEEMHVDPMQIENIISLKEFLSED